MDEWGTSIWDTPSEPLSQPPLEKLAPPITPPAFHEVSEPAPEVSGSLVLPTTFDDFEFGEAAQPVADDDFGDDFGDFDEGQSVEFEDDDMKGFREADLMPKEPPPPIVTWEPLRLDPLPPSSELFQRVQELLGHTWSSPNPGDLMTSEDIRQVEGLGQILVTPDRCVLLTCHTHEIESCIPVGHCTRLSSTRLHRLSLDR